MPKLTDSERIWARSAETGKLGPTTCMLVQPGAWHKLPAENDAHRDEARDPYANREILAAEAFFQGPRFLPEQFISSEDGEGSRTSSLKLIAKSRELIEESRQRVRRLRADMALRLRPGEKIN
jgi:hypothetical protein